MIKYILSVCALLGCDNEKPAERHGIAEPCIQHHWQPTFRYVNKTMMTGGYTVCDKRAAVIWFHGEPHRLGEIWAGAPE